MDPFFCCVDGDAETLSRVGRLTLAEEASKWWQTHGSEWMWLGSHSEQWMRLQSDRSVDNGETVDTVLPEPQRCLAAGIEWHRQVALHVTQCAHDCKMRILRVLEWAKTSLWQQVDWDTYRSLGVLTSSSTAMLIRMRIIFPVRDAVARILREEIHRFLRIVESLNEKAESALAADHGPSSAKVPHSELGASSLEQEQLSQENFVSSLWGRLQIADRSDFSFWRFLDRGLHQWVEAEVPASWW